MGDKKFLRYTVAESNEIDGYVIFEEIYESFDSLTPLHRSPLFWMKNAHTAEKLAGEWDESMGGSIEDDIAHKKAWEMGFEKRWELLDHLIYRRNLDESTLVFLKSFHEHHHFHDRNVMESVLTMLADMPSVPNKWYKKGCVSSRPEQEHTHK